MISNRLFHAIGISIFIFLVVKKYIRVVIDRYHYVMRIEKFGNKIVDAFHQGFVNKTCTTLTLLFLPFLGFCVCLVWRVWRILTTGIWLAFLCLLFRLDGSIFVRLSPSDQRTRVSSFECKNHHFDPDSSQVN